MNLENQCIQYLSTHSKVFIKNQKPFFFFFLQKRVPKEFHTGSRDLQYMSLMCFEALHWAIYNSAIYIGCYMLCNICFRFYHPICNCVIIYISCFSFNFMNLELRVEECQGLYHENIVTVISCSLISDSYM